MINRIENKIIRKPSKKLVIVRLKDLPEGYFQYKLTGKDDTEEIFEEDKDRTRVINVQRKFCKLGIFLNKDGKKYYELHIQWKHAKSIGLIEGNFILDP